MYAIKMKSHPRLITTGLLFLYLAFVFVGCNLGSEGFTPARKAVVPKDMPGLYIYTFGTQQEAVILLDSGDGLYGFCDERPRITPPPTTVQSFQWALNPVRAPGPSNGFTVKGGVQKLDVIWPTPGYVANRFSELSVGEDTTPSRPFCLVNYNPDVTIEFRPAGYSPLQPGVAAALAKALIDLGLVDEARKYLPEESVASGS